MLLIPPRASTHKVVIDFATGVLAVLPPVGDGCSTFSSIDSSFTTFLLLGHIFSGYFLTNHFRGLFSPELRSLARQIPSVLASSRAPSTAKGYFSCFKKWKAWTLLFPECKYFPADKTHVAFYLLNLVQPGYSFSRITSAFYAISFFHNSCGGPNLCDSKFLKLVLEGCKMWASSSISHRNRLPILPDHLQKLVSQFASSGASLFDIRDVSLCLSTRKGYVYTNVGRVALIF